MIKKFGTKKRRGALIGDALIGLIIVIVAIIPTAGAIHYTYYSIISSREISDGFNKFSNEVDDLIWERMNDPALPLEAASPGPSDPPDPPANNFRIYRYPGAAGESINMQTAVFHRKMLEAKSGGGRDRKVPARVFIVRQP